MRMDRARVAAYCGPAADQNRNGVPGAIAVAEALAERADVPACLVGSPGQAPDTDWSSELEFARAPLENLASNMHDWLQEQTPIWLALPRCSAAIATVPAVARAHPQVCLLWIDAHGDLNTPAESASGYLGGMALAGATGRWDTGLGGDMPLSQTILVGGRELDSPEQTLVDTGAVSILPCAEVTPQRIRDVVGDRPVYVHIDCDVFEPGLIPTEYTVPDGLRFDQLGALSHALSDSRLIGVEIAEFETAWPDGRPATPDPLLTALIP